MPKTRLTMYPPQGFGYLCAFSLEMETEQTSSGAECWVSDFSISAHGVRDPQIIKVPGGYARNADQFEKEISAMIDQLTNLRTLVRGMNWETHAAKKEVAILRISHGKSSWGRFDSQGNPIEEGRTEED